MDAQIHPGEITPLSYFLRCIMLKTIKEQKTQWTAINKRIRICVDCGSTWITIDGKYLSCNKCGKKFTLGG
jgi:anaerobic ribonucleoside-triphosphate reductase